MAYGFTSLLQLLNESGLSNSSMQMCKGNLMRTLEMVCCISHYGCVVFSVILMHCFSFIYRNLMNTLHFEFIGNDPVDEDVDIGGNEPPVSSYPQVETEKDKGFSSKHVSSGNSSDNAGLF